MLAKTLRSVAAIGLAGSGFVLGLRAIIGPFRLGPLPVHSALNAQCIFGLCATALLLLNSVGQASWPVHPGSAREPIAKAKTIRSTVWLLLILLLVAGTLAQAVVFPLVFDDYTLVRQAEYSNSTAWTYAFTHPGGDGFFRPIAYMSLRMDGLWAGQDALRWHMTGLILHLANIVLVWLLASRLFADRGAGTWAAAVFGIHGSVLLTPTYLAARFDVLAVFFVLAGLVCFAKSGDLGGRVGNPLWGQPKGSGQRRSPTGARDTILPHIYLAGSLVCMVFGLFTKEIAFAYPLLLLVLTGRQSFERWRAIASHFAVAAVAFVYRYWLLGGLGGYHDQRLNPLVFVKGFGLRIWSALYFPVNWTREPEFWLTAAFIAYLALLGWLAVRVRLPRQKLVPGVLFVVVGLLPMAHMLLIGSNLLGAGRFYLALAGFAMSMGVMIRGADRRIQVAAGMALLIFQFAALQHNLRIWGRVARLADTTCANLAAKRRPPAADVKPDLPREIEGVPFLANGFDACLALHQSFRTDTRR